MMARGASSAPRSIAIIPIGEAAEMRAQLLARDLRKAGFSIELEYSGNTKRRFNRANKTGANAALIIGDLELNKDIVTIRDMITGEQQELTLASLVDYLAPYR